MNNEYKILQDKNNKMQQEIERQKEVIQKQNGLLEQTANEKLKLKTAVDKLIINKRNSASSVPNLSMNTSMNGAKKVKFKYLMPIEKINNKSDKARNF